MQDFGSTTIVLNTIDSNALMSTPRKVSVVNLNHVVITVILAGVDEVRQVNNLMVNHVVAVRITVLVGSDQNLTLIQEQRLVIRVLIIVQTAEWQTVFSPATIIRNHVSLKDEAVTGAITVGQQIPRAALSIDAVSTALALRVSL